MRSVREKRGLKGILGFVVFACIFLLSGIGVVEGSWVSTLLDSRYVGYYSSIALDSNNKVHISYYDQDSTDGSNYDLKYITNESGSWVITTVDSSGTVGYYTSIAIDSNNKVHISYYDNTNADVKYATNASGSWVTTTVDSTGGYTSIAIDSNNKVHISYFDYRWPGLFGQPKAVFK